MTYDIRLTPGAEADLQRLYESIAEQADVDRAHRWYESFVSATERLRSMPMSCGLAHENPWFREEIRHLLFGVHPRRKFRALFTIRGDEVVILTIRAPGERPYQGD